MAITAKQVNELRKLTGAGMMDCKKALEESDGDIDAAIDNLRKKGQKVAGKRADRNASEGVALAYVNDDASMGIAMTLNCETDFVAKNDEFIELANKILDCAIAEKPDTADVLKSVKMDSDNTIADILTDYMGKIGEKIDISNYAIVSGEKVTSYIHSGKIAVLVEMADAADNYEEIGKDVAMQIAAMNPVALDETSVDPALVEREKAIGREKAREEGKPENILDRIAEGYMKKYFQENTLLHQPFVKNPKQTVKQYVGGTKIKSFKRLALK